MEGGGNKGKMANKKGTIALLKTPLTVISYTTRYVPCVPDTVRSIMSELRHSSGSLLDRPQCVKCPATTTPLYRDTVIASPPYVMACSIT